ncbi:MAG: hypothetical protein E6Q97_10675 [Desulfurellales bacterium]|nr:MAG: hypothetical protein E6Q97_10675 [Desulfurellales bacterium]
MPTTYPTAAEVTDRCAELGFTAPAGVDSILAAVIADWKRQTGYRDFLTTGADADYTYDPPYLIRDYVLDLERGFVSFTAIEINGTELTETDDYDLLPLDVTAASIAAGGAGWREVRFKTHPGDKQASVTITRTARLYAVIPGDVYQAILDEAAGRCYSMSSAAGAGISSVKQGAVSVTYDSTADSMGRTGFARIAAAQFENTVWRYKRMVI